MLIIIGGPGVRVTFCSIDFQVVVEGSWYSYVVYGIWCHLLVHSKPPEDHVCDD